MAARLRSGVLELLVPEWMPRAERERWAEEMRQRLERRMERARPSDDKLAARARALNDRHFGGRLRWTSIAFAEIWENAVRDQTPLSRFKAFCSEQL